MFSLFFKDGLIEGDVVIPSETTTSPIVITVEVIDFESTNRSKNPLLYLLDYRYTFEKENMKNLPDLVVLENDIVLTIY